MKTRKSIGVVALLCVVIMLCSVFSGCNLTGSKDPSTLPLTESTDLMPGYIDDNTSQTQSETDSTNNADGSSPVFNPDGPVKGENNNSQHSTGQSAQSDNSDKNTQPANTEAGKPAENKPAEQTKPQETTEDKSEAPTAKPQETTQAPETEPAEETKDATEAPVVIPTEKETETTKETEQTETQNRTEHTEPEVTEPDFTLPELPDSDIIGPKPPVNPDDLLPPQTGTTAPQTTEGKTDVTVESTETAAQSPSELPTVPSSATAPVDYSGRLEFTYYGRYSGKFVEDGTDEYVQNVAILLVTNISQEYLEYAVATFDIDGEVAAFVATGLAPGESCWALEKNRLQVEKGATFTHVDDIASFTEYVSPADTDVAVALSEGQLAVKNNTGKDLSNVYVYYKQVHTDGNFLGGITYRVPIGNLQKDEEASSVAMHCSMKNCKVVSITYSEEG